MSKKSDVVALMSLVIYSEEEAQRLRAPDVVIRCLRIAATELARTVKPPSKPAAESENSQMH